VTGSAMATTSSGLPVPGHGPSMTCCSGPVEILTGQYAAPEHCSSVADVVSQPRQQPVAPISSMQCGGSITGISVGTDKEVATLGPTEQSGHAFIGALAVPAPSHTVANCGLRPVEVMQRSGEGWVDEDIVPVPVISHLETKQKLKADCEADICVEAGVTSGPSETVDVSSDTFHSSNMVAPSASQELEISTVHSLHGVQEAMTASLIHVADFTCSTVQSTSGTEYLQGGHSAHAQDGRVQMRERPASVPRSHTLAAAVPGYQRWPLTARESSVGVEGTVDYRVSAGMCRAPRPPGPLLLKPADSNRRPCDGSRRGRSLSGKRVDGSEPTSCQSSSGGYRERNTSSCSTRAGISSAGSDNTSFTDTSFFSATSASDSEMEGKLDSARCALQSLPPIRIQDASHGHEDRSKKTLAGLQCHNGGLLPRLPTHHRSVSLGSGACSQRSASSSSPWVLENARTRSPSVLVRIVSECGVRQDNLPIRSQRFNEPCPSKLCLN
jgi:hypothetical protein